MAALSMAMHNTTKIIIAFTLATALASTAEAQDSQGAASLGAPTGPAPAPVVVPVSNTHQQQQQQQVRQQQVQQQAPVQQAPYPQQQWGYQYQAPARSYPVAAAPGTVPALQYGYQQPTPQYHFEDEERATRSLYMPGIILFGVGWIGNFAILTPVANAMSTDDTRDPAAQEDAWAWSLVPIIGPIAQLAVGAPHPAIPITTGLMQIGGLALFIAGLLTKETVQVRVLGPPDGNGTTVDLDAAPVQGGGVLRMTVGHL